MVCRKSGNFGLVCLVLVCIGAMVAPAVAVPQEYTVTSLGVVLGMSINSQGQVVGVNNGAYHAYLWSNGQVTTLPTLGGIRTYDTVQINDLGQVVGNAADASNEVHPCIWENDTVQSLGQPSGVKDADAKAINDHGEVAGWGERQDNSEYGFFWQNGQFTTISGLPGHTYARAIDINNSSQVVGFSSVDRLGHATGFIWQNGVATPLGSLSPGEDSVPTAINDLGQVAGWAPAGAEGTCAFLWQDGNMTNLGKIAGYSSGYGEGINNLGQVVGVSYPEYANSGTPHACLFEDGQVYDLNDYLPADSGWTLEEAYDINDSGQIVGYGLYNNSEQTWTGFLLTPVPEPATPFVMLAAGLPVMLKRRRRRS